MKGRRINTIRDLNRRRVLEFIVSNQPTSRVAIAKSINLTKATVSAIVLQLLESGIILESQSFESTGGRKPTSIILNKSSYHVVAINYSRGFIHGGLINLEGTIVTQDIAQSIQEKNFKTTLDQTFTLIDSLLEKLSDKSTFKAVSISVDGSVRKNSMIKLAHNKGWEDININEYIEQKYNIKTYTNNEANLAAIGENCFFRQTNNLSMISMHTGVGLGTIADYFLIGGYDGLAGEIGHTIVNVNGIPCSCGNNGCVEQYVTVNSLLQKISKIVSKKATIKDVVHYYSTGNQEVLAELNEYCKYLGILITNTINLVNPEELIIANELLDALPILLQTAQKYVNLTVSSCNSIRLSSSKNIELLGASVVAIRDYLSIRYYFPNIK